ncbi:unnamed protein product [Lactuca saligna]|uniref:Uncharacterized protein n=1 Tax=Lactuca saligna TaxID=75948 RepID=A0AA35YMZ3_LACSI|nr:unnamed protein product [Lactuca saligna]
MEVWDDNLLEGIGDEDADTRKISIGKACSDKVDAGEAKVQEEDLVVAIDIGKWKEWRPVTRLAMTATWRRRVELEGIIEAANGDSGPETTAAAAAHAMAVVTASTGGWENSTTTTARNLASTGHEGSGKRIEDSNLRLRRELGDNRGWPVFA